MKIFKFGERVIYTDTSSNEKLNGVVIDVDTTKPFCEVALFNGRLKRVHTDFLNAAGGGLDWQDTRFDTPPEEGTPVLVSDSINIIQTRAVYSEWDGGERFSGWEDCDSDSFPYFAYPNLPSNKIFQDE